MVSRHGDGDAVWIQFLSRWGLVVALAALGLFVSFFLAAGSVASRPSPGDDYMELLMAAHAPGLYRLAMTFDALAWAGIGGLLVGLGMLVAGPSPLRGVLAAGCGVTMIGGVIGGFTRLAAIGDLGNSYVAANAADQAAILSAFRTVDQVVGAHFSAGQLTQGVGFLLVGTAALSLRFVPRTAAWLMVVPGTTSLALLAVDLAFGVFLFPLLLVHVLLVIALGLVLARAWWSGQPDRAEGAGRATEQPLSL